MTTHPPRALEVAVLTTSNLIATLVRFVLLRLVFRNPNYRASQHAVSERS